MHGKRPSSDSLQNPNKKRRSRSRSPPNSSRNKYAAPRQSNGHTIDKDKLLTTTAIPTTAVPTTTTIQQHLFSNFLRMPGLMNADKSLPPNGMPPGMAHPWSFAPQADSQRERLLSRALNHVSEHNNETAERTARQFLELERAKASSLCNPAIAGLNGFHHTNSLSSLGGLSAIGIPPPLIPTSQPTAASHHQSPSVPQPNSNSSDSYRR